MQTFKGRYDSSTMQEKLPLLSGLSLSLEEVRGVAKIRRANTYALWECLLSEEVEENGRKKLYLSHGWKSIAVGNGISDGDTLYFEYHGNSVFTLSVIGMDKVSKEIPELVCDAERARWKEVAGMWLLVTPSENSMAAASYMVNSDKEKFMVTFNERTLKDGCMALPTLFVRKNLIYEGVPDDVPVVLELARFKATVAMRFLRDNYGEMSGCILNSNFKSFAEHHRIVDGGVVVFELQSPFDLVVFKLTLFNK